MRLICYITLLICTATVLLQAIHPAWKNHLIFDIYTYFDRATYFLNHLNLSGIANEYHPGAVLFFIMLSPFLLINSSLDAFLWIFFSANILFIFLLAFIIEKITNYKNILVLSILILFTGPIIFYRFELLVVLLTVCCYYFFQKNRITLSLAFLALATLTKLYPLVYLPYFLITKFKEGGLKYFIKFIFIFFVFVIFFLMIYLFSLQINLTDFILSFKYHSDKPVGVEGLWASIISLFQIVTNGFPSPLVSGNKTWGVNIENFFLPAWVIENFWILALEIIFITVLSFRNQKKIIENLLIITLTLVIFSKLSAPQYLMWFLFLLPLINFEKFIKNAGYSFLLLISLLVAFLSQYIYPLNYDSFLSSYSGGQSFLFYLNIFRNLLLIILLYILIQINKDVD